MLLGRPKIMFSSVDKYSSAQFLDTRNKITNQEVFPCLKDALYLFEDTLLIIWPFHYTFFSIFSIFLPQYISFRFLHKVIQ